MTAARRGRTKASTLTDEEWAFLNDQPTPRTTHGGFVRWSLEFNHLLGTGEPVTERLWAEWGERVLAGWLTAHPGTRPRCWWRYSAPRGRHPDLPASEPDHEDPRRRIGGVGTPACERLAYVPRFERGVPVDWDSDMDAADPPTFESQAAYLDRHGLLTTGERRRLSLVAFDPEPFTPETTDDR